MSPAQRFAGVAGLVSLGVLVAGRAMVGPDGDRGVEVGVGIATLQALVSWVLAAVLFSRHRFLAYGLGMLIRLGVVGATALVLVPATGLAAMPTLFALVSVLSVLAVLEPVFFAVQQGNKA